MTRKQIAFCRAYFEHPVGADAARKAGYSEKTARQIAWKIIHKSKVNLDALLHAYRVFTMPGWRRGMSFLHTAEEAEAARKAFLKTVNLPAWFVDDVNNGRYKAR
jgi:hypothetical protein